MGGNPQTATPASTNDKPLEDWLHSYLSGKGYQALTPSAKADAVDYLYKTRVVPYYQQQGATPPPFQAISQYAAHYNVAAPPEESSPGKLALLTKGVLSGFTGGAMGVVRGGLKYNPYDYVARKIEGAIGIDTKPQEAQKQKYLDNLALLTMDKKDWFDEKFGKPVTFTDYATELGGELAGQAPYFNRISKALKLFPAIKAMAEGKAAIPLAPILQKTLIGGLEGGAAGLVMGEDPKGIATWAATGAILTPLLERGINASVNAANKGLTAVRASKGTAAVTNILAKGITLAKTPAAQRPAATTVDDVLSNAVATSIDEDGLSKTVATVEHIIKNPDPETIQAAAAVEYEATRNVSPTAQQNHQAATELAQAAGVQTPVERTVESVSAEQTKADAAKKVEATPGQLPKVLSSAKPKFQKQDITFESDIDKALYIVAQESKSKADQHYMDWLKQQLPDKTEAEIRQMGKAVREKIKGHVLNTPADSTTVDVPTTNVAAPATSGVTPQESINMTVSETEHALLDQIKAVHDGTKTGIQIKAEDVSSAISDATAGLKRVKLQDGSIVIFREHGKVNGPAIRQMFREGRLNEILGYPVTKEQVNVAVSKGEKPVVVTATDKATGGEVQTVAASSSSAAQTVEAVQAQHPKANVEVKPASEAGVITKERAQQNLEHDYNNYITGEYNSASLGVKVDSAANRAKIAARAEEFIKAGGTPEELDKLITEKEQLLAAKLESAKVYAEKLAARKAEKARLATVLEPDVATSAGEDTQGPTGLRVPVAEGGKPVDDGFFAQAKAELPNGTVREQLARAEELKREATGKKVKAAGKTGADTFAEQLALAKGILRGKTSTEAASAETVAADKEAAVKIGEQVHSQVEKGQLFANPIEEKKVGAKVFRYELNDLGMNNDESLYRRVLASFGFGSSSDVPASQWDTVREAMRTAFVKTKSFVKLSGQGEVYRIAGEEEAGAVTLAPKKIFDASNGYSIDFAEQVLADHPKLFADVLKQGQKWFQVHTESLFDKLQAELGLEGADDYLRSKGYDALSYGKPGKTKPGEASNYHLKLLENAAEPTTVAETQGKKLIQAAKATGATPAPVADFVEDKVQKALRLAKQMQKNN